MPGEHGFYCLVGQDRAQYQTSGAISLAFTPYKPGQGYWTRVLSGVGAGVIVLAGSAWLWNELSVIRNEQYRLYIQAGVVATVIMCCGGLLWWLLNKPSIVDFMIATESEMRKVNWPTRREIIGSTWIVISGTMLMAVLLFGVNLSFSKLFMLIGVLEGG